jgi:acyl-CoA synthetase (NDP forming)
VVLAEEERKAASGLEYFFRPRGVAVVGATVRRNAPGYVILDQLRRKFRGRIYPVNPKYREVLGLPAYPSLLDVPDPLDLAVVVVAAPKVPEVVEEAGRRGVPAVIVVSGGFAEVGGEGEILQRRLAEAARKYGVRVIGPNCMGILDTSSGVDTFFLPEDRLPRPPRGSIAIASQSGALLSMWLEWLAAEGIGVSKAVSYGNKVDVDEVDVIEYLVDDPDTRIILLYVEGLRPGRGRAFIAAVRRALAAGKPVVALKGGRTGRGALAAKSHTAALASGYQVYRAVFRQAGVVEVDDMQTLFDVAKAYVMLGPLKGRRLLIVTNAGGEGVLATDYADLYGLEVPVLPPSVRDELRRLLPPHAVVNNPVDLTADTDDERYRMVYDTVLSRVGFDAVLVIAPPHPPGMSWRVAEYTAEAMRRYGVAFAAVVTGGKLAQALSSEFERRGVPAYPTPERAIRALAALADIGEAIARARRLLGRCHSSP